MTIYGYLTRKTMELKVVYCDYCLAVLWLRMLGTSIQEVSRFSREAVTH